MWQPLNLTTTRVALDFSSSFGSHFQATRLNADSERLTNAIELIDWSDDPIQVDVCEECGITHCKPGGWVTFRRCGQYVLVLPAFAAMVDNELEYSAPEFLLKRGPAVLTAQTFSSARSIAINLPPANELAPLTRHEAVRTFQWEAPGHVLGRFPAHPILDRALVLATDSGEPAERVERLNSLLTEMFASGEPALPGAQSTAICLYLDLPGYPEWQALYEGDRLALVLSKGLAIGAA